jgi:predicted metal-dependent enzyme (double-stranded beta helix superfamily)
MTYTRRMQRGTITRLSSGELEALVLRIARRPAEWITKVRLDAEGRWYERIHLSGGHEVWLISWLPGQSTGFHDHGGSAGAFAVVWGELMESRVGAARAVAAGTARAFGPKYVHDVRNASSTSVAVSVHAYSPPLSEMTRYALTEAGLVRVATEGSDNW